MFCPNCHYMADAGAAFCANCGTPLQNQSGQTESAAFTVGQQVVGTAAPQVATDQPQPDAVEQPVSSQHAAPAVLPQTPGVPLQTPTYGAIGAAPSAVLPTPGDHSGKAIAALVCGVVGLAGSLKPLIGITLGILALVFGTISFHSSRRIMARIGIGLGVVVIALSLLIWVHDTTAILQQRNTPTTNQPAAADGSTVAVTTPCYTTRIAATLKVTQAPDSCTFQGVDAARGEQVEVKVLDVPALTTGNLSKAAKADAQNVLHNVPGGSISKQGSRKFAGSETYEIVIKATDGSAGTIEYIYDTTSQGNLVIVIRTQVTGRNYDVDAIESSWQWL